jgi:hypothetical protein
MLQGWTLHSNFLKSMQKWRVDLWHLATIEAAPLFLRVTATVVAIPQSSLSSLLHLQWLMQWVLLPLPS